ncbi:MAG: nuclear transport factor 2 family protein [Alphaproteobacteria bacterium]|nr:nuclear transport factor 2 family protein [Alphaproteobacteria bacterium]
MEAYIQAFNNQNLNGILALFNESAQIHSPTQPKPTTPRAFFPGLLERSVGSRFTTPKFFLANDSANVVAMHFNYEKALPDGGIKTFDCVDIFTFEDGIIADMRIIFDTKNLG